MSPDFFNLNNPRALQGLWALVPLAILFALDMGRRQRVLRLFVSKSLLDDVSPRRSISRPIFRFFIFLLGASVLIFALARPRWAPKEIELEQQGQNILFLLDVSNSMRARDVDPSRLEAAKAAISSFVSRLRAGHQIGLLAYAGDAELKCPLTPNYTHFQSVLQGISYNSVDVGGSNLGDAIYKATHDVFGLSADAADAGGDTTSEGQPAVGDTVMKGESRSEKESPNVLIVLTDGESHEGHARAMAQESHALGVGIYLIGFGSQEGAPIPMEVEGHTEMLKYKGTEVITKLDDESLRNVIEDLPSRRGYLAAGTANVDLTDVYNRVIAKQGSQKKQLRFTVWQEKFQLFVGLGMALLVVSWLISEQRSLGQVGTRP